MSFLLNQNLYNLDAFWSAIEHEEEGEFNIHKNWPNKIWKKRFDCDLRLFIKNKVFVTVDDLKMVNFATEHVKVKVHLIAMSISLANVKGEKLEHIRVIESQQLEQWAKACSKAFAYEVDVLDLWSLLINENATIFAYWVKGNIVGTAITYQTDSTMGVHQVGVLPKYQGKGIGKCLMRHVVAYAHDKGCELMTLQASEAGLLIYLKMGFKRLGDVYHLGFDH